jgi:Domain of unknown function (DUF4124)
MALRIAAIGLVAGLLLVSAAAGETIYKYRQADGQVVYSNRPISGAVLLEQLEYEPPPARIEAQPDKSRLDAEQRISKQLAALEQAWQEVQDARQALARAEERLRLEAEPKDDEVRQMVGGAELAPPAAGGPQGPAPPAVGGPQPPVSPAVGGPMGKRQGGGGRSAEYHARALALEADLLAAQARFDAALRRYNALR